MALAKRLLQAVNTYDFEYNIRVTISIGISQYKKNDNIELWIERSDRALYQAKIEGRNCFDVST